MRSVPVWLGIGTFAASLACGGGGGGGGGVVVDNSAISEGIITRIGSAEVTGTLWDTTSLPAQVIFDELDPGDPADLAPGMLARLQGQRDANDPGRATASIVLVQDAVQGPIESVTDVDSDRAELVVVGRDVVALKGVTFFGGSVPFDSYTFDDMAMDDVVEVWGYLGGDGVVQATRIEKLGVFMGGNPAVSITGPVENLMTGDPNGGTFDLNGLTVTYLDGDLAGVPGGEGGLAGKLVGVRGSYDAAMQQITATDVQVRGPIVSDVPDFELEGIVSDFTSLAAPFRVASQPVQLGLLPQFEPPSLGDSLDDRFLADGMRVAVAGTITGGTLLADRVRFRDEEVFIAAQIPDGMAVDEVAGTIRMLSRVVQPDAGVTVIVDDSTRLEDEIDPPPLTLGALMAGNYLEIRGIDLDGQVLATSLVRKLATSDVVVRGRVESFSEFPKPSRFTLLGLDPADNAEPIFTAGSTNYFEFPVPGVANESQFYAFLIANPRALIEVSDLPDVNEAEIDVANEIEYEDE
jgi:hypothetical protein